jgi:diguanylate cyclase (GGDEF)-like protein
MAAVTLIEQDTQQLLCTFGAGPRTIPRGMAICDLTIRGLGPLVVEDVTEDPRFRENPLVTGPPHIRSYAGVPVHVGHVPFGALCVLDVRPRARGADVLDLLRALARQVDRVIELHRRRRSATAPDPRTSERPAARVGALVEADATSLSVADGSRATAAGCRWLDSLEAHLRADAPVALVSADLDHFKGLNDSAGHLRGDELLVAAAARLAAALPEGAVPARRCGDEFAVLLPDTGPEEARRVAERMRRAMAAPYELGVGEHLVTASLGVAVSSPGMTASELLARAAEATQDAKRAGRNCVVMADAELRERHRRRDRLASQLAVAEENDELQLYYQPVVALRGPRAGRVDLVEALLRWHPSRAALMPPTKFLDVAEEAGLMGPIGRWVLREACAAAARWLRSGRQLQVSVNCSVRQFTSRLASEVADALAASDLAGERLVIEVTEQALSEDHDRAGGVIEALAELGVQVVIDDFGVGYSSLGRLQELAIAGLKIDRAFALGLVTPQGFGLYRAMVEMADAFGLEVTAEGIETPRQLHAVSGLGCEAVQGFLLGRAAPEEVVPERSAFPVASPSERPGPAERIGMHAG